MNPYREQAVKNIILSATVGSRGRGVHTEDSDLDLLGVFVEPKEAVMGLSSVDHCIEQTQEQGERASSEDTQRTLFSLRKFARLARKGNPSAIEILFLDAGDHPVGKKLQDNHDLFVSKHAVNSYFSYMRSQRWRLDKGEGMKVSRPELVEKYGYDVKYGAIIVLLGLQCFQILESGKLTLPLPSTERDMVLSVRSGKTTKAEVLALADEFSRAIEEKVKISPLRNLPDEQAIDKLLVELHEEFWSGT